MGGGIFGNVDCSQAGQAGARDLPIMKPRRVFVTHPLSGFVKNDLTNREGSGTDEAHVAAQNAENLRQFVQSGRSQDAPHTSDALIILPGGSQPKFLIGIRYHCSKFQDLKFFSEPPPPLLAIEDGAAVFELNGDRDEESYRSRERDHYRGDENVERPLQERLGSRWYG